VSDEPRPHFLRHLNFEFELRHDEFTGRADVPPMLRAPGTDIPRAGMLATYADHAIGFPAVELLGAIAPTLDLSLHVFRLPTSPVVTMESHPLKAGRRVAVGEAWFTAEGEPDPFAVSVATFMATTDPGDRNFRLPTCDEPPFAPHAPLDEPIEQRAGITEITPGTVELATHAHVSNGRGTIQGGMLALLVERACDSALGDDGHHLVTGLDLRYLGAVRVGPARATATPLRSDEQGAHFWVEIVDAGNDDRLAVHALGTARRLDTV
jgi:acyl-coenzyme A thioesterase PaaI-like protein